VKWGMWHVLSPLDQPEGGKVINKAYPPEDELRKMLPGGPGPDLAAKYAGKSGKEVAWREVETKQDIGGEGGLAPINLAEGITGDDQYDAVGYLYRTLMAKEATAFPVSCGADDGMRLWLNGE